MRIVHISQHYRPVVGGQEVYIRNLIAAFEKQGHKSTVCQLHRGSSADAPDVCQVPRLPFAARLIHGFDSYQLALFAPLFCRKELARADVIIAHYAVSALFLRKYRAKTIVLSHGIEWKTEVPTWEDKLRERFARRLFPIFMHVANDTHYLRHMGIDARAGSGFFQEINRGKWFIPNCVDTEHFRRWPPIPELAMEKTIFVPRQITPDRGIDLAIKSFSILARRIPDLRLLVAGKVHGQQYMEFLMSLAREGGAADRVVFMPPIPNEEMPQYYSSASVTVIPTLRREGTSLSALESMSCGTATVSTNVAGLADLPTLQSPPEPQALAAATEEALRSGLELGARQQARVQAQFNMINWVDAWLAVVDRAKAVRL